MRVPSLPQPAPEALHASDQLCALIAREIERKNGWISFARYMELALYTPGLGYYSGGAAKLGAAGDFITAPELTPLFGYTLAQSVAQLLAQTAPHILEFGAGSGQLAFDILTELTAQNIAPQHYAIVELSGELRARQQEKLRDFPQVVWWEQLPSAFSGVVIANEVLDAMPVHLLVKTAGGWMERGVAMERDHLVYLDRHCDPALYATIPEADALPVGYLTEIHPTALAFITTLAHMLNAGQNGAALLIDYGFPAAEYYLAQRAQGTLMCHYRHHAHGDPFFLPGLQDITAHVNFSAIAHTALQQGLELLGYTSQAAFLLQAGLGDLLMRTPAEQTKAYLPLANAVQKLTSPAEMGELFKVLMVGTGVQLPVHLMQNDRSHRL